MDYKKPNKIQSKAKEFATFSDGSISSARYTAAIQMADWLINVFVEFIEQSQLMDYDEKGNVCIDHNKIINNFQKYMQ